MSAIRWTASTLDTVGPSVSAVLDEGTFTEGNGPYGIVTALAFDAYGLASGTNPTAVPYPTEAVIATAYNATIKLIARPSTAQATARAWNGYAGIEKSGILTGSKFILRDIARLPWQSDIDGYSIRFRVISHDRNRSSAWSPFYTLHVPADMQPSAQNISLINVAHYSYKTTIDDSAMVSVVYDKVDGTDTLDIYSQPATASAGGGWTHHGWQWSNQASNICQFKHLSALGSVRYSFHRRQISPADTTESTIYPSRIFITDWISLT